MFAASLQGDGARLPGYCLSSTPGVQNRQQLMTLFPSQENPGQFPGVAANDAARMNSMIAAGSTLSCTQTMAALDKQTPDQGD